MIFVCGRGHEIARTQLNEEQARRMDFTIRALIEAMRSRLRRLELEAAQARAWGRKAEETEQDIDQLHARIKALESSLLN